jgi:acetolactate synthase-1/2/3 large subunit
MARGLVDEDMIVGFPWYLGFPAAQEADLVVFAGTRMRSGVGFASPPFFRQDARFIQVDIEASEIGRNRYVEAPVVGDCGVALETIADELARANYRPRDPGWVGKSIKKKLERIDETGRNEAGMPHPLQVARELAKRMPENAIFIGDGANVLESFRSILRLHQAPGWMDHQPFGSMGVGLPLGIGVVAAQQETGEGRPVFVCTGDGSLGMYLAELATASLHELPMLIMVGNDGGWGASRNVTLRLFNGSSGCDMRQSRYDLVAEGLDCHGEFVPNVTDLAQAFDRSFEAMRNGKTVLMNYLIDRPTATSRGSDPLLNTMPYSRAPGLQGARKAASRD